MQLQKIKTTMNIGPKKGQTLYGLKAVSRPNITGEALLNEIRSASTFSAADSISIFREFAQAVVNQVANGNAVDMGELGILRPTLTAKAVDSRDACDARTIRNIGIRYTPRTTLTTAAKSMPLTMISTGKSTTTSGSTGTGGNNGNGNGNGGNGTGTGTGGNNNNSGDGDED